MTRAESMRRHPAGRRCPIRTAQQAHVEFDALSGRALPRRIEPADRPASRGECAATVLVVLCLIAIAWALTEVLRAVTM